MASSDAPKGGYKPHRADSLHVIGGLRRRLLSLDDLGSNADIVAYGLVAVSAATVGLVLASCQPRQPVGYSALLQVHPESEPVEDRPTEASRASDDKVR